MVTASFMYGSDGNLAFGYRFKFDNSGQRLESEYLREDSTAVGTNIYKYSDFDKKGNWRKCVTFYNGNIYMITTLRIEYYLNADMKRIIINALII